MILYKKSRTALKDFLESIVARDIRFRNSHIQCAPPWLRLAIQKSHCAKEFNETKACSSALFWQQYEATGSLEGLLFCMLRCSGVAPRRCVAASESTRDRQCAMATTHPDETNFHVRSRATQSSEIGFQIQSRTSPGSEKNTNEREKIRRNVKSIFESGVAHQEKLKLIFRSCVVLFQVARIFQIVRIFFRSSVFVVRGREFSLQRQSFFS